MPVLTAFTMWQTHRYRRRLTLPISIHPAADSALEADDVHVGGATGEASDTAAAAAVA